MKTRKVVPFWNTFKNIVFNEVGSVGSEAEAPAVEAPSDVPEVAPESSEDDSVADAAPQDESSGDAVEEVQATNEGELKQEIEEAIEEGASKEEVKQMIRQYNIKVGGKEMVAELDVNDEEAVKRQIQLARQGQITMQEKAELEKNIKGYLQSLQSDPFGALKQINPDFDEMAYLNEYVNKLVKENELTPAEKEAQQRQEEYEAAIKERDELKKRIEEEKKQSELKVLAEEIQSDIMGALETDDELVADRETVALVAKHLEWAAKKGMDLEAKDVIPTVKKELALKFESYANRYKSTSALKKYMGSNVLERLRQENLELAKKQQEIKSPNSIKTTSKAPSEEKKPEKKINLSDFIARK